MMEHVSEALTDALISRAEALSSATLHEAAGRRGSLPAVLKPIERSMRFAGRALPVRSPSGDNLQIHLALAAALPGDVLVVETGTGTEFGYWGEIMATAAIARRLKGIVITGGVRDSLRLIDLGLPTFAAAITVLGTRKDHAKDGAVGEPVRIGEVVVRRGDLVMGDADGVVVFPSDQAEQIIDASERRDAAEVAILEQIRGGALTLDVYKL
jgi:4-hydroxy-4-methyl-2-oxoglutarate aldolase